MLNIKMNQRRGWAWFVFYAEIRPFLICISTIRVVAEFLKNLSLYMLLSSYRPSLIILPVLSVIEAVLGLMIFKKSRGDYVEFVDFAKRALMCEAALFAIKQGISSYGNHGDLIVGLGVIVFFFIPAYFLWYRLNMKYFVKRINVYNLEEESKEK